MATEYLVLFALLLLIIIVYVLFPYSSTQVPLPPGPKGHFFSGIKSFLPSLEPWRVYAAWSHQFNSSIISFRVYNRTIVVLNDAHTIQTLLNKRAEIYSDRPVSQMLNVICRREKAVFNISSRNERHKQYRKLLQTGLGVKATREYWPIIQSEIHILLDGLATSPERFMDHIRRNATAVIMQIAYGYSVKEDDPFIQAAEESSKITGWALASGRWLVDYYPIARFLPSIFKFQRLGREWRERLRYLSDIPHDWVKDQMRSGNYTESLTSRLLESDRKGVPLSEFEDTVKWCAGGLYAGSADTTVSALVSFILLMALHPVVQSKARQEIDSLIGHGQIPHPSDVGKMVYLTSVMKEVLRFAPVANLALPHRLIRDDFFMGYRIPKGATIISNVWAVMHDDSLYPEPFTFTPERFLCANPQPDPKQFAFGYGRRTCPGNHFAETSMLFAMACILARFEVTLPPGKEKVNPEFTTGITSHIKPFDIVIKARVS